jgi:hypothetical protein
MAMSGSTSARAAAAGKTTWSEVTRAYEDLAGSVFDQLDARIARRGDSAELAARSLSRQELRRLLVDEAAGDPAARIAADDWEAVSRALEVAETVRFTGSAGVISEADARAQLGPLIDGAQRALSK